MSLREPPSKTITVCHVAVGDLWAGAEVQLATLLSFLIRAPGFDFSAVLLNEGKLADELRGLGVKVTVFAENSLSAPKIFVQLVKYFRRNKRHIIHTHKYKDTILAAPAAKLCGIPHVVRTVHGLPEPFQGLQALKIRFYETIERIVSRNCVDATIGVSSQIESKYKTRGEVGRVACIRNGIDLKERSRQIDRWLTRKELGIDPGTHVMGTVGRLTSVKGLPYLLMAAKNLLNLGMTVKVLIVGEGSIRSDLETQARDLGISEDVVFAGYREDTDDLLRAMDIFVLPSLSEGIPMALLEAMAASRVVIASRVGGIPEVIDDGVEGFLVEPRDVNGLTETCLRLIQSPVMAKEMGEKARKRVERDFSAEEMAHRVASLYHELIKSKR